jgi:hypothetical protein
MADLTRLLLRTGAKWRSVTACEHQWRPWRGGARPCSGVTGAPCPVASSRKHQDRKGKVGQELDEREERSAALAIEDCEGGSTPVSSVRGKDWQCAFTFARLTQARGVGGRGVQGRAIGEI